MCSACFSGGVRLQSLQSWTALTAAQLHFWLGEGWGLHSWGSQREGVCWLGSDSNSHCQSWTALTAAQLPLLILSQGDLALWLQSTAMSWTALTAATTSTAVIFRGGCWLQSLQSWTALTTAQLPLLILGGLSDCSHYITKCNVSNSASFP